MITGGSMNNILTLDKNKNAKHVRQVIDAALSSVDNSSYFGNIKLERRDNWFENLGLTEIELKISVPTETFYKYYNQELDSE